MRKMLCAAVVAAFASANAAEADWTRFLGSNPYFPTQLAGHGLAVDDSGYIAVQAYNRLAWSGQIEFTHEYTLAADGSIPWIWGLVGRNGSHEISPQGVDQRDGYRAVWLTRADDPWSSRDELALTPPGSSQPGAWLSEPRSGGSVVRYVSGGSDGAFALRALDAGGGFEVIALDGSGQKWRTTVQPCITGSELANLEIDYSPNGAWPMLHTLSVAGSCDDGVASPQVFVQRFDTFDGTQAATEWLLPSPDSQLARLAFSAAHELVAVYTTPWPHQEVHRVAAPGAPYAPPPDLLFGMDQIVALTAGGEGLAIVGTDFAGEPAVATVMPFAPTSMPQPLAGLTGFPGGGWTITSGRDGKLLALRSEAGPLAPQVRLVGLDADGLLEWTDTIEDVLPGSAPQAVPAKDLAGGFLVAVDQQDATGTLGVLVRRVGSSP
jgi:hypothetical protein